jgi:hypothetical protein
MKYGEIRPSGEMNEEYRLTAEKRPVIRLDAKRVPIDLRDLIPLAEKWGISDDIIRDDFQSKASQEAKSALVKALSGRNKRITQWLDSFTAPMSAEAATFMFMQQGLDEMGLWVE